MPVEVIRSLGPRLKKIIESSLKLDPRPNNQKNKKEFFCALIEGYQVAFEAKDAGFKIKSVELNRK